MTMEWIGGGYKDGPAGVGGSNDPNAFSMRASAKKAKPKSSAKEAKKVAKAAMRAARFTRSPR